jgi:hypothetical protein
VAPCQNRSITIRFFRIAVGGAEAEPTSGPELEKSVLRSFWSVAPMQMAPLAPDGEKAAVLPPLLPAGTTCEHSERDGEGDAVGERR